MLGIGGSRGALPWGGVRLGFSGGETYVLRGPDNLEGLTKPGIGRLSAYEFPRGL